MKCAFMAKNKTFFPLEKQKEEAFIPSMPLIDLNPLIIHWPIRKVMAVDVKII